MSWKPKDAYDINPAIKKKKIARLWAQVANDTLQNHLDHGVDADEAKKLAIDAANQAAGRVINKTAEIPQGPVFAGGIPKIGAPYKILAAEAGDQANLVMNEFLPKIGEHWARVAEPEDFNHETFRADDIEPGIRCISAALKDGDGSMKPQAYHFDKRVFAYIADVQRWLSNKNIQATKLEPAKDVQYPKMTCGADLRFEAEFAALESQPTQSEKLPSIDILAYNGGPLSVKGYDLPVVVDIPTLRADADQTPIITDHAGPNRVGHADLIKSPTNLRLSGVISCVNAASEEVLANHKNGFKWKASIGCAMGDALFEYYAPGESLEANGQRFQGPLYYAKNARLAECSLVTTGADNDTQVTIAAQANPAAAQSIKESLQMPQPVIPATTQTQTKPKFKAWLKAKGLDKDQLEAAKRTELRAEYDAEFQAAAVQPPPATPLEAALDVRKQVLDETTRIQRIRKMTADVLAGYGGHADGKTIEAVQKIELEAIGKGWDARDAEIALLRQARPVGPALHIHDQQPLQAEVLEAAACIAVNLPNIEKHFKPEVLQASHDRFHGQISLQQLMLEAAWANGCPTRFMRGPADVKKVMNFASPGHYCPGGERLEAADASTLSLPGILSNLQNKILLEGFWAVESVWRDIAAVGNAKDFKPHYGFRFYGDMTFEGLGAAGEIKHGKVGELKYANQVSTRAKMFVTTYEDIINDDLGAISQTPRLIGMGAAYDLNQCFWAKFLAAIDSQGNAMWSSARKNLLAGTYSYTNDDDETVTVNYGLTPKAGIQTLTAMKQAFLEQKKPDNQPVAVAPKVLLTTPKQADFAKRLIQSSELRSTVAGTTYPIDNPHAGLFKLAISSYLATAFGITGADDDACWLLADPAVLPIIEVLFLNGQQTPTVQSSDADFNVLGFQHRGWWAHGVALQEYRGGVMATPKT